MKRAPLTLSPIAFALLFTAGRIAVGQFDTIINVPPDVVPSMVGSNTQVNILSGQPPSDFTDLAIGNPDGSSEDVEVNFYPEADWDAVDLDVYAGGVLNNMGTDIGPTIAHDGSVVNITARGRWWGLYPQAGSEVNIFDGADIRDGGIAPAPGSKVWIAGGEIGEVSSSTRMLDISGGEIRILYLRSDSLTTIRGGDVQGISPEAGSELDFWGTKFLLDGTPITGLTNPGDTVVVDERGFVLSGFLADGSPIERTISSRLFSSTATLRLTLVPEPSSIALMVASTFGLLATARTLGRRGESR